MAGPFFPVPGHESGWSDTWGACRPSGGNPCGRRHQGTDIAAPEGSPLVAVDAGTVTHGNQPGVAGQYVNLDTADGDRWFYAHLSRYAGPSGRRVEAGETIGYVGTTGNATGPHLHIGLTRRGTITNPAPILSALAGRPAAPGGSAAVDVPLTGTPIILPDGVVLDNIADILDAVPTPGDVVEGIGDIASAFGLVAQTWLAGARWMADRRNWFRIAQVAAGAGLVGMGLLVLLRDVLGDAASVYVNPGAAAANLTDKEGE